MLKRVVDFVLVFCFVFCFNLRGGTGIDSSILVAAYLIVYAILHPHYIKLVSSFFLKPHFKRILGCYIIINIWCFVVLILRGSSDIAFLMTFLHMFFLLVVGCLFFFYFEIRGNSHLIVNYLVGVFILQAAIEWTAFTVPPFKAILNITKSEATIEKGLHYAGIRANALAGSDFFGLSAAFGFIYLIYYSKKNSLFSSNRVLKFLVFLFLITGTFFAGRSGYIGVLVLVLYLIFNRKKKKERRPYSGGEKALLILIPGLIIGIISYAIILYSINEDFQNLMEFTFELFTNYSQNKTLEVSSVSTLEEGHFPHIEFLTYLIGDGKYGTHEGYYMETDVGVMRVILYMGIIGLIMMILMELSILQLGRGNEKKLKKYIFLLLIILSFKGEVLVWGQIIITTLQLYVMQDLYSGRFVQGVYSYKKRVAFSNLNNVQ